MSTSAHRSRGGALGGLGVVSMVPRVIDSMCTEFLKPGIAVSSWAVGTTAASAVLTLLGLSVLVTVTRIGYGMLRAYYILRVRAGVDMDGYSQ